jgi:hypothetical protein
MLLLKLSDTPRDALNAWSPCHFSRGTGVTALAGPEGDVAAGCERVRVIGAEHARPVGQQRLE